ncbi:MAG: AI-2E family transporter, partial [Halobacteria archaeon]|nr:AI-2E family transporter [Halobacteria archaeon]
SVLLVLFLLSEILGTVFFAVTVAYVFSPLHDRLVDRGIPEWWASAVTTVSAFATAFLVLTPLISAVYLRRAPIIEFIREIPPTYRLEVAGYSHVIDTGEVESALVRRFSGILISAASELPVVGIKMTLFALVVFAFLMRREELSDAVLSSVPREYHDVVDAVEGRVKSTLFAIYVLQVATAVATFVVSLLLFSLLGYPYSGTLAVVAAVLQFLPIVGPSVLIVAMSVHDITAGNLPRAAAVAGVGLVVVAWLPDAYLRPRLSESTTGLPGSLYFIGFVGGILSLGPIGVIAGPLAVALVVELTSLLADENTSNPATGE